MPFQKCPFKNALYQDILFQIVLCNALSQFALYQTAIKQERSIFIIHVISDCEFSNAWGVDFRSCFFSWQSIFFSASFLVRIALTGKGWNSVEQRWNKLGHIRGDASEQFRWSGWAILGRQRARPLSVSFLFCTSGKYHSQAGSTNHINMKLIAFNFTLRRYWGGVPTIDKQCHQSSQVCLISDTLSFQSIDKVCEPFLLPSRIEYKDQANQKKAPGEKIFRVVCCHSGQPNRSRGGGSTD